jgi:photosystem II stability/assembly factor-like uncharacterized protein
MKNSTLQRLVIFISLIGAIAILHFSCKKDTASVQPPKINSFISNPGIINEGDSSTLSWSVDNATYVTINGETVTGSSKTVTPDASAEYTLVATNSGGWVNAKTTVTVNLPPPPPPPIDTLGSGWEKITLNDSSYLADIFFVNKTGFAIGAGIHKSSDGGKTWSELTIPSGVNSLFNMGMGNEMNAIFVSSEDPLVSTRDGGVSFTVSTLPDNFADVFFVDSTTAYAAGTNIWKTTDAGTNWVNLYSFASGGYSSSLYFLNAQMGWVSRNDGLYKTVNAGVDWSLISTQFYNNSQVMFFLNSDTGYISGGSSGGLQGQYLHRTMDGGVSWTNTFTADGGNYLDVHFVSDRIGYVTDNSHIYKTEDGGNTWTSEVHLASNILIELHFTDADHGWACGTGGTILKYSR